MASNRHKRGNSRHETESLDRISRSSSTGASGASTWGPSLTPGEKLNIQDPSDDQSMNWVALGTQSPFFDPSNVAQFGLDSFCWQQPSPNKNGNASLTSPIGFNTDMMSLSFNTHRTTPNIGYEESDGNQPLLELHTPQSTRQQSPPQQQQQQKSIFPGSQSHYSDSIELSDPSNQSSPSYNQSIASANSTNSTTSNANQCISLCTQIIVHLESQMNDSSLGLDGVLRISKSCMNDLLRITTLESCKANLNCLLLLCVAVNQMTTLFENNIGVKKFLLDPLCGSTLPSLLFGTFQVDQEDQLAFCTRLICREIQRCRQLLDRMSGMNHNHQQQQQSDHSNKSAHSTANLLQKQWFLASLERLDSLIAAVTV